MGKLIDLTTRIKIPTTSYVAKEIANVVDYDEQKQKIIVLEKRQIKRTILTEFVSAMVVIPEKPSPPGVDPLADVTPAMRQLS